jgi:hypothetical protein
MNGNGYVNFLNVDINNNMNYIVWIILGLIAGFGIYWIMDWHDKHPDGE